MANVALVTPVVKVDAYLSSINKVEKSLLKMFIHYPITEVYNIDSRSLFGKMQPIALSLFHYKVIGLLSYFIAAYVITFFFSDSFCSLFRIPLSGLVLFALAASIKEMNKAANYINQEDLEPTNEYKNARQLF